MLKHACGQIRIDITAPKVADNPAWAAFMLRRLADDIERGSVLMKGGYEWEGPIWEIDPDQTSPSRRQPGALGDFKWQQRPKWWWNLW